MMYVYILLNVDDTIATIKLYATKALAAEVAKKIAQPNDKIRYIPADAKLVIDHQATESRGYTIWRTEGEEILQDRHNESDYSETWTIRQYKIEGYNHDDSVVIPKAMKIAVYVRSLLDRIDELEEEADRLCE